jgi:hypothetical protein
MMQKGGPYQGGNAIALPHRLTMLKHDSEKGCPRGGYRFSEKIMLKQ